MLQERCKAAVLPSIEAAPYTVGNLASSAVSCPYEDLFDTHSRSGPRLVSRNRDGRQSQASQPMFLCGGHPAVMLTLGCTPAMQPSGGRRSAARQAGAGRGGRRRPAEAEAGAAGGRRGHSIRVGCRGGCRASRRLQARRHPTQGRRRQGAEEAQREGPPAARERLVRLSAALAVWHGCGVWTGRRPAP